VGMAKRVQLRGEFKWDNSRLKRGLAESEAVIKRSAGKVRTVTAGAMGFMGIGAGLHGMKQLADEFDRIGKLSSRFGIGVESLQRMGHAAKLSGATMEQVAKAMNQLVLKTQDQAYADDFAAIGLSIDELRNKNPEQMFKDYSTALAGASDTNKAMALNLKILGEEGNELWNMISGGGQVIDEMGNQIRVMSEGAVRDIEMINDEFSTLVTDFKVGLMTVPVAIKDAYLLAYSGIAGFLGQDEKSKELLNKTSTAKAWDAGLNRRAADARRAARVGGGETGEAGVRARRSRGIATNDSFAGLDALLRLQSGGMNGREFNAGQRVGKLLTGSRTAQWMQVGDVSDPVFGMKDRSKRNTSSASLALRNQMGENVASIRAASADAWVARNKKKDEDNLKTIATNTQRTADVLESL